MKAAFFQIAAMFMLLACVTGADGQPAFAVTSVSRARLTEPAFFWRTGSLTPIRDLIVIRIDVRRRGEFVPRDISGPLFLFGSTVGILIQSPRDDGKAIVVAPRATSAQTFWLSRSGLLPRKLVPPLIDRLRQQAVSQQRSVQISPPAGAATNHPNLEQLVRSLTITTP